MSTPPLNQDIAMLTIMAHTLAQVVNTSLYQMVLLMLNYRGRSINAKFLIGN